jgi:septum formation protein
VARSLTYDAWVLGADTVVVLGATVFGKPKSAAEARRMLQSLAGQDHQVVTGVAWVNNRTGETHTWFESTRVHMRVPEKAEVAAYMTSGEWKDKAGAYGIQGRAGAFVTRVEGCYFNVVGLPLGRVCAQWNVLQARQV